MMPPPIRRRSAGEGREAEGAAVRALMTNKP
jgi:hypothetical protein